MTRKIQVVSTVLCFVLVAVGSLFGNQWEEAYRKQRLKTMKVGDWAEFEISVKIGAPLNSAVTKVQKTTVTKVDAEGVSFTTETTSDASVPKSETRLTLKEVTKPVSKTGAPQFAEGSEQIFLGEKDYSCQWFEMSVQGALTSGPSNILDKTWYCDDVPVFGLVKRVFTATTNTVTTTTETLRAFGTGK
ncbi:MAG: hypothetical protein HQM09_17360 [Candidatus Riflebacteria bacterium]|nr:hypothetical protein [Candidatus Riflebacteria bacterium]